MYNNFSIPVIANEIFFVKNPIQKHVQGIMIKKNKKRASSNEPTGNGTVSFEYKALLISSIKYQISSIRYDKRSNLA